MNIMEYLKSFSSHTDYEEYLTGGTMVKPNVSYCEDVKDVHYNPIHDYSQDYFTIEALDDGTISFDIWKNMRTDMITSISYSTDNGKTWTTTQNQDNKTSNLVITVNINKGDKVLWKGVAQQLGLYDEGYGDDYIGSFFSSTCPFDAMGNVMSLLYGDDFVGETTIENDYCFSCLFFDFYKKKSCGIVNANNLVLPATTLAADCYSKMFQGCTNLVTAPQLLATTLAQGCCDEMFYGCTSLTTAPTLPATTLVQYCYSGMFNGCTSLTTAPELPATTLTNSCYFAMFIGCTSLTSAPELPATTLAQSCYSNMFSHCSSLTTAPELPATTLVNFCYNNMFQGCTSLTTAPSILPATTLAKNCYAAMFDGCTSLTSAPELPAITLAQSCYSSMFRSCTSLTTAPELPATTLVNGCYSSMFEGCTSLNYIKAMFATTPSSTYTDDWVDGVAASGTFVKNSASTWNPEEVRGVNGIPTGWTVQTASE